jgi:hypothetical protein
VIFADIRKKVSCEVFLASRLPLEQILIRTNVGPYPSEVDENSFMDSAIIRVKAPFLCGVIISLLAP